MDERYLYHLRESSEYVIYSFPVINLVYTFINSNRMLICSDNLAVSEHNSK